MQGGSTSNLLERSDHRSALLFSQRLPRLATNVLAGAMILFYRPFHKGSHITVSGYDGVVTQIDLRYTRLRTKAADVLLPNSTLLTHPITVHDERPPAQEGPA